MNKYSNFSYTDLSLMDGIKPFDGMAAGRFVDMWGRETVFLPDELPEYVKNTKLALASTMTGNGQVVGFPIDQMNHDGGRAAGWIVDVNLSEGRDVIEFTPRWNSWGREAVGADELRFFSPTIDVEKKVIIGGSLTNWPATRNAEHQILLRPVELSEQMQTYTTAPIVSLGQVLRAAISEIKELAAGLFPTLSTPETGTTEGVEMDEELTPIETEAEAETPEAEDAPETPKIAELAGPVTIANAGVGEPVVNLTSEMVEAMVAERAEQRAQAVLAQRDHEAAIAKLAGRLVGGTPEKPTGLPVGHDRIVAFLSALPKEMVSEAGEILLAAAEHGPVSYDEAGHSRVMQGTQSLPDEIKPILHKWLDAGKSLEGFFQANAVELGLMSDYNLSEFIKE